MLINDIKAAQVAARKSRFTSVAGLLTTLIGEVEMVGKNANREVTDEDVTKTIRKFIKNLDETIVILGDHDPRTLLAMGEKMTLERFLPKQLTEEELRLEVRAAILALQTSRSKVDMGSVMGLLKNTHAGLYDGKLASQLIKAALS